MLQEKRLNPYPMKLFQKLSNCIYPMPKLNARMKYLQEQKQIYTAIINMPFGEHRRAEHTTKVEQINVKS